MRPTLIRRLTNVVALLLVATVGMVLAAPPAHASCSAPFIELQSQADAGSTVLVRGEAFGDQCYDTGVPAGAAGVLGDPLDRLEMFVEQGDESILVAKGAADSDYAFTARIVVPVAFVPGTAIVRVTRAGTPAAGSTVAQRGFTITGASDDTEISVVVADLEPAAGSPAAALPGRVDARPETSDKPQWVLWLVAAGAAVMTGLAALRFARRQ